MLKITTIHESASQCVLRLEGKLLEPWIDELCEACRQARRGAVSLTLNLSGLSFLDACGISTLRNLFRQGVTLHAPSPLVTQLLKDPRT